MQKRAAASAAAIFRRGNVRYACMLILVELPTNDYEKVTLTLASGSAAALTEEQVLVGEDVTYLAYPAGFYDSTGITPAYANFTLTYNGNSVKYEFDVSDITLDA